MKKLGVTNIPAIEEVNLFTTDSKVIHFQNPKVQASIAANTYVVSGPNETKSLADMLPSIMNQLGNDAMDVLKQSIPAGEDAVADDDDEDDDDDDDIPDLVENFEEVSKS